jgi:hypothetical protein
MPYGLHSVKRNGPRRQIQRRTIASVELSTNRRSNERRSGQDRRRIRNHDLAPTD